MNVSAYTKELEVATDIVRAVGGYLRNAQKQNTIVKQPHGEGFLDVTTYADLEAERMAINVLTRTFPHDHILSEETRTDYSPDWERAWIIDPLDGTTNYVKGLDAYAVSITLVVRGKVAVAVVCLPVLGEVFHAVRGQGVFRNGQKLVFATSDDTLAQSLVSVGFPHSRTQDAADQAFSLYARLWLASSDLRRSASAVYDGCLLATGIIGAYLTPDIKPWDIAAGCLFIEEQGGITSDFNGQPLDLFRRKDDRFSTSVIFAKNAMIHSTMLGITKTR